MQVTSDYYRCRAQRAANCAESLTLLEEQSSAVDGMSSTGSAKQAPLRPSRRTLRSLADLHKSEDHTHVA